MSGNRVKTERSALVVFPGALGDFVCLVPTLAELRRPLLLIHPGSGGRSKRWSRSGFVEVAARSQQGGAGVAVVCGPAEGPDEPADWQAQATLVLERLDVVELAAVAAVSDRYLG